MSDERIAISDPDVSARAGSRVMHLLSKGAIREGAEVSQFESEFADHVGRRHAVATVNGSAALQAALEGAGIGEGDRVVTSPLAPIATANAVRLAGADPVFVDVERETLTLDPAAVERSAEDRPVDAILVEHLYGHPADMDRIEAIADRHGSLLVEDVTQAHGATYRGRPVGSIGDLGCFSFSPSSTVTTVEGGIVVTDDGAYGRRTRQVVHHGRSGPYVYGRVGHDFGMTNLAGAIGLEQLDRVRGFVDERRSNAALLGDLLEDGPADVEPPVERPSVEHAYNLYTIRHDRRGGLAAHLDDRGIETGAYYPRPIHEQPAYDGTDTDCPVAERATDRVLSLPIHPGLTEADVRRIAREVNAFEKPRVRS